MLKQVRMTKDTIFQNKKDNNKSHCPFLWWALEDCLESLALNVSTDFASMNFIHFAKFLRTLLAPRSNFWGQKFATHPIAK